jgi:glycosyltransferase involved in cell wall biosynthesis
MPYYGRSSQAKRRMRILVICAAGIVSGKEIMTLHLLRELKNRGHNCFCILSTWGSDDFRTRLRALGVSFYNLRIGFISKTFNWSAMRMTMVQGWHMPLLLIKYFYLKRKLRPDVIIHTNFHHAFLLYPLLQSEYAIYWSHEIIANGRFYRWLFNLFNKKINIFVGVSNAVASSLSNLIDHAKVTTIRNGITLPEKIRGTTHKRRFTLAIVGQISRNKGHEVLLHALAGLREQKILLKIFGSGDKAYVVKIAQLIRELELENVCELCGFVANTDKIYDAVDLVLVPSIFPDPYPTIVMEAGVRGIPVVGSKIGGIPEMIDSGVNGYLVKAGDSEELRRMIVQAMNHSDLRALGESTMKLSLKRFDVARFGDDFEKLIFEKRRQP